MSRTKHITHKEANPPTTQSPARLVNLGIARPRQAPVSRLTRDSNYPSYAAPDTILADGNAWQGTIADVGGHARRRHQHDKRDRKKIGRRRARRAQQRDTAIYVKESTETT